jgi:hypothetical protein
MSDAELLPTVIDTSTPNNARVYDAMLGGKDNYEVDRESCRALAAVDPKAPAGARLFRDWLIRVTRFLAGRAGIDQFLDLGCGLPTLENTHEVAQRFNPQATVVYVDNDPLVAVHGRALLEDNNRTHFAVADLRCPEQVLNDPAITRHLDLNRPLALMQCAPLHHLEDSERPYEIMMRYIDALPSGSYVALSHLYDVADGSELSRQARAAEKAVRDSGMGTSRFRTYEEIAAYFEGLELLEPGLVKLHKWWPDGPPPSSSDMCALGAVGRKP